MYLMYYLDPKGERIYTLKVCSFWKGKKEKAGN